MDFKFRTIELLEIFVNKSKNPENFIACLTPLIDCIKENLSDSKKQTFIEKYISSLLWCNKVYRIGNLIKKYFEKHLNFSEEVLTDLKNCLAHVIYVNAKFVIFFFFCFQLFILCFQDKIHSNIQNIWTHCRSVDKFDSSDSRKWGIKKFHFGTIWKGYNFLIFHVINIPSLRHFPPMRPKKTFFTLMNSLNNSLRTICQWPYL